MELDIQIALIEDDPVIRKGLLNYFQEAAFCAEAWGVNSMEDFFKELKAGRSADVVLTDIGLPGMSGTDGIRLIRERLPEADVIMLTVFRDETRIFKSLCAGATGYLLKDTPFDQIKEAIRVIRKGGSFMSPAIARMVVQYFNPPARENDTNLTARESQIIQGLMDGLSYKLIADRLSISIDTIRYHIKKIYNKVQVNSRTELIRKTTRSS